MNRTSLCVHIEGNLFQIGQLRLNLDHATIRLQRIDTGYTMTQCHQRSYRTMAPLRSVVWLGIEKFLQGIVFPYRTHLSPLGSDVGNDLIHAAVFSQCPYRPNNVTRIRSTQASRSVYQDVECLLYLAVRTQIVHQGYRQRAVAISLLTLFGSPWFVSYEHLLVGIPELADTSLMQHLAVSQDILFQVLAVEQYTERSQRVLAHGCNVKVQCQFLVLVLLVRKVVDVNRADTDVFRRDGIVYRIGKRLHVMIELLQTWEHFGELVLVAGIHIIMVSIEAETDAVVQDRSPGSELNLTFEYTHQSVPTRPAVHEVTFQRATLTEGVDISAHQVFGLQELVYRM